VSKAKVICVATGIFPPDIGGPSKFAETFLRWCQQNNQRVEAVSLTDTATRTISFENIHVKLISRDQFLLTRYAKTIIGLSRKLLTKRTVLANGLFLEVYFASLITSRKYVSKVPGDIVWERARNSGYTKKSLEDFQQEPLNLKYRVFRSLFSRSLRRSQNVIVPTKQLQELCFKWGVSKDKVVVIPNSVDTDFFVSDSSMTKKFDVIVVNRLVAWKHVDSVISACAQLGLSLAIVGDGPDKNQLEALAIEQSAQVTFFGNQTQLQVLELLQKSSCFVLNSSFEATAYSLLEARSVGIFTIATRKTGSSEVVGHYSDGLLCDDESLTLKEALKVFMDNEDFVRKAVANARADTEARFSVKTNYLKICKMVLEKTYEK
jgi:glycosyltransferase involved in cell wall biosynthesis